MSARARRGTVLRPDELAARDRGTGARTVPLATTARGATTFLNGITRFEAGAVIGHHLHNVTESVIVVEGDAVVDIDGERTRLRRFDTTLVPGGVPHHFENASDTEPMTIFWTYASLHSTRTLLPSGERSRIDAEGPGGPAAPLSVVREVARITVLPGRAADFEAAVSVAGPLLQGGHGARTLTLERSHEDPREYRLDILWDSVEDHVTHFRGSADFEEWRRLIAPYVAGPPEVTHFRHVLTAF